MVARRGCSQRLLDEVIARNVDRVDQVHRGGVEIRLSPKEFSLLEFLMRHEGEVLGRSQILDHVWDFAYDGTSNVVDVYIRYLREKIDRPFGRDTLETVRGVGYRLRSEG